VGDRSLRGGTARLPAKVATSSTSPAGRLGGWVWTTRRPSPWVSGYFAKGPCKETFLPVPVTTLPDYNRPRRRLVESPTLSSLIASAERGDRAAAEALFALLYSELHRMARRELARSGAAVTLGATTLLHEAYLDISGRDGAVFPDRGRFMAYAARVMRGLIIDYARKGQAQKRGGHFEITRLGTDVSDGLVDQKQLSQLGDALDELATVDPALAEIVDLKFFCGCSFAEIAAMREVSERTVQRQWDKARIYLHHAIRGVPPELT
jgi:RNA polymerase sigma factor (TIGR02999 family)